MAGSMSICTARAAPSFGRNSDHGKPAADHEQCVAAVHQVGARTSAEEPDRTGDEGQVVGKNRLAEQGLGDAGSQPFRDLHDLVGSLGRSRADQDCDLLAGVEQVRRSAELLHRQGRRRAGSSRVRTA